jgi:polyisoprenoid-binding protein YceI
MRNFLTTIVLILSFSSTVYAEAIEYDIISDQSDVGFTYQFGKDRIKGQFTQYSADISIDFEEAMNSQVDVVLNTATAKAGFVFATQALRSKKILNTASYPNITFTSKSVRASGRGAVIDGLITVRGITKPLTLKAEILRDPGTLASERTNLRIRLTGQINRNDFGASGYPGFVDEMLAIKIDARIKRK